MPHYLYQTEGFIIGSRPIGEGSRALDLLTDRLGRMSVLARGVRESRSKLRCQLNDLNFVRVALVRGRELWRLTGAEAIPDFALATLIADSQRRLILARLASILRRFLTTDPPTVDQLVYSEIRAAISFLAQNNLSVEEQTRYEAVAVWRLLAKFGYGRRTRALEAILSPIIWSRDLLTAPAASQVEIVSAINEALYHSHL